METDFKESLDISKIHIEPDKQNFDCKSLVSPSFIAGDSLLLL